MFFESTIMGNTADLAMVQKTIIDTLHKEGKSQRVITERGGSSQSAVSKHIKCKVFWKEEIWKENMKQATGMTASLRILSSKADSNTWESFTRSELKLESVHQESPRSDIFRKRATKPLQQQKHRQKHLTWVKENKNWTVAQWSKVLFSDESKFCFSFGNQGPRVWRKSGEKQNPCCLKSSVKFPQSVMIWAAMSSAGVGPLCFLKSKVNAAINQEILEHFMLPSADKLYGDTDFIFQQDLAPAHTVKGTKSWFNDHGVTVLDWPAISPDLNPIENLRWETPDPTMQMSWRPLSKQPGLHYTSAVPQADRLHATPHWCSNSCKRRPNQVLSA